MRLFVVVCCSERCWLLASTTLQSMISSTSFPKLLLHQHDFLELPSLERTSFFDFLLAALDVHGSVSLVCLISSLIPFDLGMWALVVSVCGGLGMGEG